MNGIARKVATAIMTAALLFAFLLSVGGQLGIQDAAASPISTTSDGWTRENFASSCKAAGGHLVEIDSPGIKYSKCVFPGGGVNKCDWIKKTCTFGMISTPNGGRFDANISTAGVLEVSADANSGNEPTTQVSKGGVLDKKRK